MSELVARQGDGMGRAARLAMASAFLGWMFDSFDLNLFTLVMIPAVRSLTGHTDPAAVLRAGGAIVAVKILGWGLGGVLFGVAADRFGRRATMVWTILIYSAFTALSGLAQSAAQLGCFQFLAGVGIGGEWAAGTVLVAETVSAARRVTSLYITQMAFPFGYFLAAGANALIGPIGWRWVMLTGLLPALIVLPIRAFVRESAPWIEARASVRSAAARDGRADDSWATLRAIFSPGLRRRTTVGVLIALAMMVGSWAGFTLLPGWITQLAEAAGVRNVALEVSRAFVLVNLGTVAGFLVLIAIGDRLGRRKVYFAFCAGALAAILFIFRDGRALGAVQASLPLFGFFAGAGFGTFAVYLPELYPTPLRATGAGFCYNISRALTFPGPLAAGALAASLGSIPVAASLVSLVLLVGMVAVWFGPETAGAGVD